MKRRLFILLLISAAVAAGAYYWRVWRFRAPADQIAVSGNIELTLVDMSFKIAGRLVELDADEGDFVKAGQVIARLDSVQLEHQKARDMAAIGSAQSAYDQLKTSIEYQRATLESEIAARQAELNQAKAQLEELLAGSRAQEIQQAEAALSEARAQLEGARSDYERAQMLFKNEDISRSQFDAARTRFDAAQAVVRQAQERLALVKEGPRKEQIAAAQAQVARAQAAVKNAEAGRLELERKQEELAARKAEIERARAQAGISQAQLGDTTLTSPISGVVLVKSVEPGEVVAAGTTLLTIGDLDHPWLRAYINETDLGRVKLGQRVTLTTDSYPGKTYDGRVSFIASQAEFTPKQIQTKEERVKLVYRIKVDVENPHHELKDNMPVDAVIHLSPAPDEPRRATQVEKKP